MSKETFTELSKVVDIPLKVINLYTTFNNSKR